jgi:hypothetical protein
VLPGAQSSDICGLGSTTKQYWSRAASGAARAESVQCGRLSVADTRASRPRQIPLSPVGWLTVTVDALKHPPFLPGQNAPDAALWVVVRAVGAEQHAAAAEAAAREAGENGGAETLTAGDEVRFESSLNFAVRRPQLQDRSQQVVVEVHGSQGIHGSVALSLSRATRPGGEYDGVYELMHPEDPSGTNVARGYKQHATSPAPTSVFLRFYYVTSSQKSDRSSQPVLYSRGPVMPFSDKDLGMNRPASQKRTRPPSGALPSRGAVGILVSKQLPARPPSAQGRPQSAQPDLASHSDPRGPRSRLPSRPQSADPRQRPGQSSSFDEYPFLQPPLQLDFRPKSPTDTSGLARPQSATVRSKRSPGSSSLDPIFWDSARVTTSTGRPASAGARRPGNALMRRPASAGAYRAGSTPVSNAAIKTHVLMMPLARAAELKVRETAVKEDIIIPEITDEITDAQDAGNTSVFSIISREDAGSGLSLEARSILQQIEASARCVACNLLNCIAFPLNHLPSLTLLTDWHHPNRDWTGLQTLLKLPKEGISDVVKKLFDKVDTHREGSVPWDKFGDAMLLLCGKHFSVCSSFIELADIVKPLAHVYRHAVLDFPLLTRLARCSGSGPSNKLECSNLAGYGADCVVRPLQRDGWVKY